MSRILWHVFFSHGCSLKWWYPQNTLKWSFLVGKPMVVGYHHFRNPPHGWFHACFFLFFFWKVSCFPSILKHGGLCCAATKPANYYLPLRSRWFLLRDVRKMCLESILTSSPGFFFFSIYNYKHQLYKLRKQRWIKLVRILVLCFQEFWDFHFSGS